MKTSEKLGVAHGTLRPPTLEEVQEVRDLEARIAELEAEVRELSEYSWKDAHDRLRDVLALCASQAGIPDPAEACREILKTIAAALKEPT